MHAATDVNRTFYPGEAPSQRVIIVMHNTGILMITGIVPMHLNTSKREHANRFGASCIARFSLPLSALPSVAGRPICAPQGCSRAPCCCCCAPDCHSAATSARQSGYGSGPAESQARFGASEPGRRAKKHAFVLGGRLPCAGFPSPLRRLVPGSALHLKT